MVGFDELNEQSRNHYGELVAMDRSIGTLRLGLVKMGIEQNTLVWFCSDNGGLPKIEPTTVGPLRGHKGTIYEGGLRVPAILEWPAGIPSARQTDFPASVADILPTLLAITSVPYPDPDRVMDGISLLPVMRQELLRRKQPIFFRHIGRAALIDNDWKLLSTDLSKDRFELYDVVHDRSEQNNIADEQPQIAQRMRKQLADWNESIDASDAGKDYPEGRVNDDEPKPRFWTELESYQPYFDQWRTRWQYGPWLKGRGK